MVGFLIDSFFTHVYGLYRIQIKKYGILRKIIIE